MNTPWRLVGCQGVLVVLGTEKRIATSGVALLAMTGFFDSLKSPGRGIDNLPNHVILT